MSVGSYQRSREDLLTQMRATWGGEHNQTANAARSQAEILRTTLWKMMSGQVLNKDAREIIEHINDADSEIMILSGRILSISEALTCVILAAKEGTLGLADPLDALEAIMDFILELQKFNSTNVTECRMSSKCLQKAREVIVPR